MEGQIIRNDLTVLGTHTIEEELLLGLSTTVGADRTIEAIGSGADIDILLLSKGIGTLKTRSNYAIDIADDEDIINLEYHIGHLASKPTSSLLQAPTATEDLHSVVWDETNQEYTLIDLGGGITADNGVTKTGSNIQWGGPLVQNTDITGAFTVNVGTNADKITNFNVRASALVDVRGQGNSQLVTLGTGSIQLIGGTVSSYFIVNDDGAPIVRDNQAGVDQRGLRGLVDYSANVTSTDYVQKSYTDSHLVGKAISSTLGNPTVTENNYVIIWDNTNLRFNLAAQSGGGGHVIEDSGTPLITRANLNFTNGLTASDNSPDTDVVLGGNSAIDILIENPGNANTFGVGGVDVFDTIYFSANTLAGLYAGTYSLNVEPTGITLGIPTSNTGDIWYRNSSGFVTRLAATATGNALLSGTAPSWGKIGLTTHVSGVLPIANGGTNSSTQNFWALSSQSNLLTSVVINGGAIYSIALGQATDELLSFDVLTIDDIALSAGNASTYFGGFNIDTATNELVIQSILNTSYQISTQIGGDVFDGGHYTIIATGASITKKFSITGFDTYTINFGSDVIGDIYYRNSSGNLTRLAAGTATHVLTSNGAGVAPSYQAVTPTPAWLLASGGTLTGNNTISGAFNIGFTNTAFGIGVAPASITANTRLDIRGTGTTTNLIQRWADSSNNLRLQIEDNGGITHEATNTTLFQTRNTGFTNASARALRIVNAADSVTMEMYHGSSATAQLSFSISSIADARLTSGVSTNLSFFSNLLNFGAQNGASIAQMVNSGGFGASGRAFRLQNNTTAVTSTATQTGTAGAFEYLGNFWTGAASAIRGFYNVLLASTTVNLEGRLAWGSNITSGSVVEHMSLNSSGNLLIGASTITANTRVDIRGTGTGTNNLIRLADSADADRLRFRDNGTILYGLGSDYTVFTPGARTLTISGISSWSGTQFTFSAGNNAATSGTIVAFKNQGGGFNPTSGTATYIAHSIEHGYDTTGSYSGIIIGLNYDPTITSLTGATHIAARFTSGQFLIGHTTVVANNRLAVRGIGTTTGLTLLMEGSGGTDTFGFQDQGYAFFYITPQNDNALTEVLVRDSGTGEIKYRTAASLGGGGSAHVIENSGTPLTARANLNFSNGLTASDNSPDTDVKLGGTLTGNTNIVGDFSLSFETGNAFVTHYSSIVLDPATGLIISNSDPAFVSNTITLSDEMVFQADSLIIDINSDAGTTGEFLGSDGAGGVAWLTPAGGGSSVGSDNEIQASDGSGGFVASKLFFDETTGNMTLGDAGLAGATRSITAAGSATDVAILLTPKGAGYIQIASTTASESIQIIHNAAQSVIRGGNSSFGLVIAGNTLFTQGANLSLQGGNGQTSADHGGHVFIRGGTPNGIGSGLEGNIALGATSVSNWQAMELGMFITNAVTAPTGNPTGGAFLYGQSGDLRWRSSGGSIYTLKNEKTLTFAVGDSSPVSTGAKTKTRIVCPYTGTIVRWKLITDQSASVTLDVWKDASAIPTNANTITASAKPSTSGTEFNSSSTLTGWTTSVTEGDILELEVEANDNAEYIALMLVIEVTA